MRTGSRAEGRTPGMSSGPASRAAGRFGIEDSAVGLKPQMAFGKNDLTVRVREINRSPKDHLHDEKGQVAKWFNKFMKKMQIIMTTSRDQASQVDEAAGELIEITGSMMKSIDNNRMRTNAVAGAAEEMNANMESVAETMDKAEELKRQADRLPYEIDGIVMGERNMLEGYLSTYVLKLKGSPLVKEATVQKSVVEALQQNKAEGEILHFVLNIKL